MNAFWKSWAANADANWPNAIRISTQLQKPICWYVAHKTLVGPAKLPSQGWAPALLRVTLFSFVWPRLLRSIPEISTCCVWRLILIRPAPQNSCSQVSPKQTLRESCWTWIWWLMRRWRFLKHPLCSKCHQNGCCCFLATRISDRDFKPRLETTSTPWSG